MPGLQKSVICCMPHASTQSNCMQELNNSVCFLSYIQHKLAKKHSVAFEGKIILGDPGVDSGGEGKSKRAEKYGTKESKERREEPLGTMSYQTSSKRSPPFWLLIGARKTQVFCHQSEARNAHWVLFLLGQT